MYKNATAKKQTPIASPYQLTWMWRRPSPTSDLCSVNCAAHK